MFPDFSWFKKKKGFPIFLRSKRRLFAIYSQVNSISPSGLWVGLITWRYIRHLPDTSSVDLAVRSPPPPPLLGLRRGNSGESDLGYFVKENDIFFGVCFKLLEVINVEEVSWDTYIYIAFKKIECFRFNFCRQFVLINTQILIGWIWREQVSFRIFSCFPFLLFLNTFSLF